MSANDIGRGLADTADTAFWLLGLLTAFAIVGWYLPGITRKLTALFDRLRMSRWDVPRPPRSWE
jgi:hypothetical protein